MPLRVFIADDDDSIRLLLSTLLSFDEDYSVIGEAEDGRQTIDFVSNCGTEQDCPDVVVLDLNMPGMDGHAVIKHMRENCPHIHILVWSGENEEVARKKTDFAEIVFVQKGDPSKIVHALKALAQSMND